MRFSEAWAWNRFRLSGVIGLSMLLTLPLGCWAQEPDSPENLDEVQPTVQQPDTQQQLQQMQAKMDAMQATINMLTVQVTKMGGVQPVLPPKPVSPDDQDIGQELIFSPEEMASPSPGLSTSPSAIPATAPGFGGFGGRQIFDATTGFGNLLNGGLGQIQSMNPDIVVAGDFVGNYAGRRGPEGRNRIALREAEFGFSAAIDPYAKALFLFSKPENEELEVEEGYATLLALPFGVQAKIGKMRSPFGKINVIHGHDLPQTDRPDVYTNFFGEDGLVESGVAISKMLPLPWYSAVDVQLANGETGPFFGHNSLTRPTFVGRWKNFFELTDTQSVEIGLSGALGSRVFTRESEEAVPFVTRRLSGVQGVDFTYHWVPPEQRHAFVWQTEILTAQREHPFEGASNGLWGGYSFMEYKLSPRWNVGVRVDYSQIPEIANASTWAIAPYVNFWESEFGRWRLEYKHTFGDSQIRSNDQIWAQYSVILGLHPPHTF